MTDSELTPWEDINPPMASVRRHALASQYSDDETRAVFRNELTACLALVAPAGMTEEGRRDWLTVAWSTLKDIPPDVLIVGAEAARRKCDHPSKIVPTIIEETAQMVRWRQELAIEQPLAINGPPKRKPVMDRRGEPMSEEDTAELNGILEKLGASARYRPDGSRYFIEAS